MVYINGVKEFIKTAERHMEKRNGDKILYPCRVCVMLYPGIALGKIEFDLFKKGFMEGYTRWTRHGEEPVMNEGNHGGEMPNPEPNQMDEGNHMNEGNHEGEMPNLQQNQDHVMSNPLSKPRP